MSDLIDREAALNCFHSWVDKYGDVYTPDDMPEYQAIEALPNIEQPEIIRCRDCKYAEVADKEDSQDGYTCQFHRGSIWFSGSYCSWAERREVNE